MAQNGVEHEIIKSSLHPLRDDVRKLRKVDVTKPPKDTKEDEIVVVAVDTRNQSLEPKNRKEDIAKICLDFFGRGGRYAVLREKMPNVQAVPLLQYGREIFDIEKSSPSRCGQEKRFNPVTERWEEMHGYYQVWHSKDARFSKWKMRVAYFKMSKMGGKLLETDMLFILILPEDTQPSPPKKKALTQSRESKTAPVTPVKSQGNGRMTRSKTTEFHSESIDEENSASGTGRSFYRRLSASSSSSDALSYSSLPFAALPALVVHQEPMSTNVSLHVAQVDLEQLRTVQNEIMRLKGEEARLIAKIERNKKRKSPHPFGNVDAENIVQGNIGPSASKRVALSASSGPDDDGRPLQDASQILVENYYYSGTTAALWSDEYDGVAFPHQHPSDSSFGSQPYLDQNPSFSN